MQSNPVARFSLHRALAVGLLLVATALSSGCRRGGDGVLHAESGGRPNLLLITVDTVRADHLGTYGYAPPTSPALDRLARDGVTFDNAYTPVPTTAPAVASLVTGRYVDAHQVRENEAELPASAYTLGEALASAGYTTAGFYGNGALAKGFGQGLDVWQPSAWHPSRSMRSSAHGCARWATSTERSWRAGAHLVGRRSIRRSC